MVVEPTHPKNMLVKLDQLPRVQGKNKTCLTCHHRVEKGSENGSMFQIFQVTKIDMFDDVC